MSATAIPIPDSVADPVVAPEERFWKRYSPHGEATISFAGSLLLHLAGAGVLVLFAVWLASLFGQTDHNVSIEPVQLVGQQGGGRGQPGGALEPKDDPGEPVPFGGPISPNPPLTPPVKSEVPKVGDERIIVAPKDPSAALTKLGEELSTKLNRGQADRGKGGGRDGRKDGGVGSKVGGGTAKQSKRIERMLRWNMHFSAVTGEEYLAQLRDLGAILGVPARDEDRAYPAKEYLLVRELRSPGKLLTEDANKLNRIFWIDDKPNSIRDIMAVLDLNRSPGHFVAFMPERLEGELYDMERDHVVKNLRQRFDEERIVETHFDVVRVNGRYQPKLRSVTLKPGR